MESNRSSVIIRFSPASPSHLPPLLSLSFPLCGQTSTRQMNKAELRKEERRQSSNPSSSLGFAVSDFGERPLTFSIQGSPRPIRTHHPLGFLETQAKLLSGSNRARAGDEGVGWPAPPPEAAGRSIPRPRCPLLPPASLAHTPTQAERLPAGEMLWGASGQRLLLSQPNRRSSWRAGVAPETYKPELGTILIFFHASFFRSKNKQTNQKTPLFPLQLGGAWSDWKELTQKLYL